MFVPPMPTVVLRVMIFGESVGCVCDKVAAYGTRANSKSLIFIIRE